MNKRILTFLVVIAASRTVCAADYSVEEILESWETLGDKEEIPGLDRPTAIWLAPQRTPDNEPKKLKEMSEVRPGEQTVQTLPGAVAKLNDIIERNKLIKKLLID